MSHFFIKIMCFLKTHSGVHVCSNHFSQKQKRRAITHFFKINRHKMPIGEGVFTLVDKLGVFTILFFAFGKFVLDFTKLLLWRKRLFFWKILLDFIVKNRDENIPVFRVFSWITLSRGNLKKGSQKLVSTSSNDLFRIE